MDVMSDYRCGFLPSVVRGFALLVLAGAMVVPPLAGCDRNPEAAAPPTAPVSEQEEALDRVPPPENPPEHSVAPELREKYPEVTAFVDEFLATCLVGDYAKYRQCVSRLRTPESKERFRNIYYALERVRVSAIEPIPEGELRDLPSPAYLVISDVHVRADRKPPGGELRRQIAIIVFQEDGEWRMIPAPASLQPPRDEDAANEKPTTRPAATLPDFPWEQGGDG